MSTQNRRVLFVMVIAVVATAAVPVFCELPAGILIWAEIQNTGHTPLFGIIALLLLGISTRLPNERFPERWFHYAVALIVTGFLGIVTEYAQVVGPRDADLWDIVRDMAGAVSFLGIYMYFDVRLRQPRRPVTAGLRKTILFLSMLILMGSLVPLSLALGAYFHRNSAYPVICDFDSYWTRRFLTTNSARLAVVPAPEPMSMGKGMVGELMLSPGDYPGFGIREPYPDWQNYRTLSFDIYSPLDSSIALTIRVDDSRHDGDFHDRFNRTFTVKPGENHFAIAVSDIRSAPEGRQMEMGAIAAVYFFCGELWQPLTFYVDNIRLE